MSLGDWLLAAMLGTLVILAVIDLRWFILPDLLVLLVGVAGGIVAWCVPRADLLGDRVDLVVSSEGVLAGFLALWAVSWGGRWLAPLAGISKEDLGDGPVLGLGDVKLFAALGAWVGPWGLPYVVVTGTIPFGVMVLLLAWIKRWSLARAVVPFGPALCLGGAVVAVAGDRLLDYVPLIGR